MCDPGDAVADRDTTVELAGVGKRWPRRALSGWRKPPLPAFLTDVSFTVRRGEIVVILGENGAGKTTLLKIVAGLARADIGTVRAEGVVAYAGGERGFYFRLTARENLVFFGSLDGLLDPDRTARIVHVAQILDIENDLDRRYADLSTGQRQRLSFARALLADPDILLLDEPTRALDPPHATDLRHVIRQTLAAAGKTVIVATNLIEEARALGDRIAMLRETRLSFVDLPNRVLEEDEIRELFGKAKRG